MQYSIEQLFFLLLEIIQCSLRHPPDRRHAPPYPPPPPVFFPPPGPDPESPRDKKSSPVLKQICDFLSAGPDKKEKTSTQLKRQLSYYALSL